jgi:hypothetical protein
VVGPVGTLLFAPVRLVLWGIHQIEARSASAPFDFSGNNGWIGGLAALVGAGIVVLAVMGIRGAVRGVRQAATSRRSNARSATTEKTTLKPTSTSTSPAPSPSRGTPDGS